MSYYFLNFGVCFKLLVTNILGIYNQENTPEF